MLSHDKKALIQGVKNGLVHSFKLNGLQINVIPNNVWYAIEKIKVSDIDTLKIID